MRLGLSLGLLLGLPFSLSAWGGKTRLARHYRPGEQTVYQTTIKSTAKVDSNPPMLKALLPPLPTELSTRQQNTVTVRSVSPEGTAEVENSFDRFEFESNLGEILPEELKDSSAAAQEEFSKRLNGKTLTVRYDRSGKLLDIGGTDAMLAELDVAVREATRQLLRVFLEQVGGNALYPDHPVKKGQEWKRKLDAPASEINPFSVEGENTMSFAGKTRYQGINAGIIDFRFSNRLKPSLESLRKAGPLAQLEAQGMQLDIRIDGQGEGRVLVSLKDGRILQNHSTLRQTLRAEVPKTAALHLPANGPLQLRVDSETKIQMDGQGQDRR